MHVCGAYVRVCMRVVADRSIAGSGRLTEGGLCVQGSLDYDGVGQVGLLQAQPPLAEHPGGQRGGQDEGGAGPLAAGHKVMDVADAGDGEEERYVRHGREGEERSL